MDAETVLFIHDNTGQIFENNVFHKQGMRSDKNVDFSCSQSFQNLCPRFALNPSGQQFGSHPDFVA